MGSSAHFAQASDLASSQPRFPVPLLLLALFPVCPPPPPPPRHHTRTLLMELLPPQRAKIEAESGGRRATNPDFIVREGEKGKTWAGGRDCYIVKH